MRIEHDLRPLSPSRQPLLGGLACAALALALTPHAATAQSGGVSTVGRAVAKRAQVLGKLPDPATVVVADLINYHRHLIMPPKAGEAVSFEVRWDAALPAPDQIIVQLGFATPHVDDNAHVPPLDVALVVDRSGSMSGAKLDRVKTALAKFGSNLRPTDRVALVAYSDAAQVLQACTSVGTGNEFRAAIQRLEAGGNTNLHAGLMAGYAELGKFESGTSSTRQRRVILLTDGLANQGVVEAGEIAAASKVHNDQGIALSTIGVGDDFNHALLDELARAGRGSFHFVADSADIDKVFEEEAQSLLGVLAEDVLLEVACGPGAEILHVYGHDTETSDIDGRRLFATGLDNFNYGMTRVALVKLRLSGAAADQTLRATLRYRPRHGGQLGESVALTRSWAASTTPDEGATGASPNHDLSVRKNATIAVLARAMRQVAELGARKQLGEADKVARRALEFAGRHYVTPHDPDIQAVRSMLESYRSLLGKRVEAYRDL